MNVCKTIDWFAGTNIEMKIQRNNCRMIRIKRQSYEFGFIQTGILKDIGMLDYWKVSMLEHWNIGILERWNVGK